MRLIATFAAVATVNATFFEDTNDVLSRSRRVATDDDDQCAEGEVMSQDGFCFDSAEEMLDIMGPVDDLDDLDQIARKFPMGSSIQEEDESSNDATERTKRRSQRITLLVTKASADGTLVDEDGKKMRAKAFMNRVNNYGCHCWPNNRNKEHLTGYGQPLDAVDTVCHELKQCHKCINVDYPVSEARSKGCDPVTTKYKAKLVKKDGGLEIECTNTLNKRKTNNGDCKRSLCECDKAFAEQFSASFKEWNKETWNLNDSYETYCQRAGGLPERSMAGPSECCGNFPLRRAYNPANKQCVDGQIQALGNQ